MNDDKQLRVQRRMVFIVVNFFVIFKINLFCFDVAKFDLVHEVKAILVPSSLPANSIWKPFLKYE